MNVSLAGLRAFAVFLFLCAVELAGPSAYADLRDEGARNLQVYRIGLSEGLSQAKVNAIAMDAQGYMWFGTQEGLNRYDGERIRVFHHSTNDPTSIAGDWIWDVFADRFGRLWVAGRGGLNLYDPATETFTRFTASDPQTALPSDRVRVVFLDSKQRLWVGTEDGGVCWFLTVGSPCRVLDTDSSGKLDLTAYEISSIEEDSAGQIWIGSAGAGVLRFDADSEQLVRAEGALDKQVRDLHVDAAGRLWAASFDQGLIRFNYDQGRFESVPLQGSGASIRSIREIESDAEGNLWLTTDMGLLEWRGQQKLYRYRHDPADTKSLSTDPLTTLYLDDSSNLWIGSYKGVNQMNFSSDAVRYLDRRSGHLATNLVSALSVDERDHVWVGTYPEGLAEIDDRGQKVNFYSTDPEFGGLSDGRVMSVLRASDGTLWAGTRGAGLNQLPPGGQRFVQHRADPEKEGALGAAGVTSIIEDRRGDIWVATHGGGLHRYRDGRFERFSHHAEDDSTVSSDRVVDLHEDRHGTIWVGTEEGGLNRLDPETGRFERLYRGDTGPFPSPSVWHIHESHNGDLWFATAGHGLLRLPAANAATGRHVFEQYTRESHGLFSNTVVAIAEDGEGQLWLSGNRGLTQFSAEHGALHHFDQRYGLRSGEFHQGLAAAVVDGRVLFGGNSGVVVVASDLLPLIDPKPAPIALQVITRQGVERRIFQGDHPREVSVEYPDTSIGFEFTALDFDTAHSRNFRVRLEGFDEAWYDPGAYPRVSYTNLAPGRYRFAVEVANSVGDWVGRGVHVPVVIHPPPWQTAWARLGYAVIAIVALVLGYIWMRRRSRAREEMQKLLERQVQERTSELARKNEKLEQLNDQLREASFTDPLTQLRNRRYFYEVIETQTALVERSARDANGVAKPCQFFMMIDLDGFKAINDAYGHHAGDAVLSQLGTLLKDQCRKSDVVCRWGGDEFMVTGQLKDRSEAEHLAERIRSAVYRKEFDVGNGNVGRITASIGVTHYPFYPKDSDKTSWEQVADLADRAAYLAKSGGKNRWVRIRATRPADLRVMPSDEAGVMAMAEHQSLEVYSSTEGELTAA